MSLFQSKSQTKYSISYLLNELILMQKTDKFVSKQILAASGTDIDSNSQKNFIRTPKKAVFFDYKTMHFISKGRQKSTTGHDAKTEGSYFNFRCISLSFIYSNK